MKIIIAPDSFKESMTASEVAQAIYAGFSPIFPTATYELIPLADGGEGFVDTILNTVSGKIYTYQVMGPRKQAVTAKLAVIHSGKTALLETAAASGLQLCNGVKDPLTATSYGTGELLKHALDLGVEHIILGLGGSATNDGGAGLLQALGAKFYDRSNYELPLGGIHLQALKKIDISALDPRLQTTKITLASDVASPFIGPNGASVVFSPQKGASPNAVIQLEQALTNFSQVIKATCGQDITTTPGAGAAGGIGGALLAFTNATLTSGIELAISLTDLKQKATTVDILLTGEGSLDSQTKLGKTPLGVLRAVRSVSPDCTVIGLAGKIEAVDELHQLGFDAVFSCTPGVISLDQALKLGPKHLTQTANEVAHLLQKFI